MNDFVVSLNGKKKKIKIISDDALLIDGEKNNYELSKVSDYCYLLKIGNRVYDITTTKFNNDRYGLLIDGHYFETTVKTTLQEKASELSLLKKKGNHHDSIKAPMPGLVIKLKKNPGEEVEQGESIIILEAMKMENDLRAPSSGKVLEVFVKEGNSVEKDFVLLTIGENER